MKILLRSVFSRSACCLLLGGILAGNLSSPASSQIIDAGLDILATEPGTTHFDFLASPIPADFFAPGSDPFTGDVAFNGNPLGGSTLCPNDDLSMISTIVRRLADANVPVPPSADVVPIEIVELSLVSVNPIVVTYSGGQNPELWDVDVHLSQNPQPQGQMQITRSHADGGTFDTQLPVLPKFIFTRQSDNEVRELDFGLLAIPPVVMESFDIPWEDKPIVPGSCTSNWCPSPGNFFVLQASNATHGVRALCPGFVEMPVLSSWMVLALIVIFISVGAWRIRRRTRSA